MIVILSGVAGAGKDTIKKEIIKRMVQEAKDNGTAIDETFGRKTRAVLVMDSDHIVLSAVQAETVADRIDKERNECNDSKANS